MTNGYQVSSII